MDPQAFMDIATKVTKLKMYPYFDIAHYTLMCMAVRDDNPAPAGKNSHLMIYKHGNLAEILAKPVLLFIIIIVFDLKSLKKPLLSTEC